MEIDLSTTNCYVCGGFRLQLRMRGQNYMVAANRLHAALDLSLSIQLRGCHSLVKLELFHQELLRCHLTHLSYLHRVLNHHCTNAHSMLFFVEKPWQPKVVQFVSYFFFFLSIFLSFFLSKAHKCNALSYARVSVFLELFFFWKFLLQ